MTTKPKPKHKEAGLAGYISRHRDSWRFRYRETISVSGEAKTVYRSKTIASVEECATEAEARELAEKMARDLNLNPHCKTEPQFNVRLGEFIEKRYFAHIEEQRRPSTVRGYRQTWNNYLNERAGAMLLHEVRTHHIQRWLDAISKEGRVHTRALSNPKKIAQLKPHFLTKTTLGHIKHFLSGVFRYAAQQGYLDDLRADMVTLAAIPAKAPSGKGTHAYSLEEINAMLKVLDEKDKTLVSGTVVMTAAWTAMRQGELTGLTWETYTPPLTGANRKKPFGEIFVARSIWRGHVTDPKTEKSRAPVPVIPQLAQRLAEHRKRLGSPATGPIFPNSLGNPLDLNWLCWEKIRPALKDAGIEWHGWHGFRRGLASNLNRMGIDDSVIQSILRHSTVAVTQNHYIKTVSPDAVAAMRKLSDSLDRSAGVATRKAVPGRKNGRSVAQKKSLKNGNREASWTPGAPQNVQTSTKSGARGASLIQ